MRKIDKLICDTVYRTVKKHIDEIKYSYQFFGFKNKNDMLSNIKNNVTIATWALTELLAWGLKENYTKNFIYENQKTKNDDNIYEINNNFFIIDNETMMPIELIMKKKYKIIEEIIFEEK